MNQAEIMTLLIYSKCRTSFSKDYNGVVGYVRISVLNGDVILDWFHPVNKLGRIIDTHRNGTHFLVYEQMTNKEILKLIRMFLDEPFTVAEEEAFVDTAPLDSIGYLLDWKAFSRI